MGEFGWGMLRTIRRRQWRNSWLLIMKCNLNLRTELTTNEANLVRRGIEQIAALVAANITGHGLVINPGNSEFSWDFILIDASDEEEKLFGQRSDRLITQYVHSAFPNASLEFESTPRIKLKIE